MRVDITMTAALRPSILERTLCSIKQNLVWEDGFRLIVDIAPVGEKDCEASDVIDVISEHFDEFIIRVHKDSLQAEALRWTWSQAESDIVVQWEDDWVLQEKIDLEKVVSFIIFNYRVGMVYLDRYDKSVMEHLTYQNIFKQIGNSSFWERRIEKSLGGPPAVLNKDYIKEVIPIINGSVCLDILSRELEVEEILEKWGVYVYTGLLGKLVMDIGKEWKKAMGIERIKRTERGVMWF